MSDFVVHKGRKDPRSFQRSYDSKPVQVECRPGCSTTVKLNDGRSGEGVCLGCGDTPCLLKNASELTLFGALEEFPGDPSRDVCPTDAIHWSSESASVTINSDDCIGCGLCVSRCPYGAINIANGLTASVQTDDTASLLAPEPFTGTHPGVEKVGQVLRLDSPSARQLPALIGNLSDDKRNLLVRNLLHEIGLNCRTRRRGDTNVRIDAVGFSRGEKPFVAEIEFGFAVLESPRALLEDVAVLHSRYGYDIKMIDPISLVLSLPSLRSEYYQVVRDIENVIGIRCRTITIGALISLLWYFQKIDEFDNDDFTIGTDAVDLAKYLSLPEEDLIEPYPGAFTPAK